MELIKFVPEQLMILVAACYALGYFLKQSPGIKDWTIPWILIVFAVALSMLITGLTPTAFLQGVICAAAAVMGNQLYKQTINKNGDNIDNISETPKEIKPDGEVVSRK